MFIMQQLIITGDDCGLSEGINHAAARLHECGHLTAASIMVNFDATTHAFDLFKAYDRLEVGIHLNLSDGFPITRPASPSPLTRSNGQFHRRIISMLRTLVPTSSFLELVETELHAQMECFISYGRPPAHITTHRHFHISPALREIIIKLAREYQVPWLRAYRLSASVVPNNWFHSRHIEEDEYPDVTMPDHLVSIKSWMGRDPQQLAEVLHTLEGVAEIIVHPGLQQDETFPANVDYSPAERYQETQYFEQVMAQFMQNNTAHS